MSDERRISTKQDIFNLERLRAWLVLQPADKTYCYTSNGHCLISTYLADQYGHPVSCDPTDFRVWGGSGPYIGDLIKHGRVDSTVNAIACREPHTYGAALERLHARIG